MNVSLQRTLSVALRSDSRQLLGSVERTVELAHVIAVAQSDAAMLMQRGLDACQQIEAILGARARARHGGGNR